MSIDNIVQPPVAYTATRCNCDTLPPALPRGLVAVSNPVAPLGGRRPDLSGDLADLPLPLLLQTLAATGRTATVFFLQDGLDHRPSQWLTPLQFWAGFVLREGFLLDAIVGPHRGSEALARLALCPKGSFEVRFDVLLWPVDPDLRALSVDSSLLRATATVDEARRLLGRLPLDRDLEPQGHGAMTTARDFLIAWPGSMVSGAEEINSAVSEGSIVPCQTRPTGVVLQDAQAPADPFASGEWISSSDWGSATHSGLRRLEVV